MGQTPKKMCHTQEIAFEPTQEEWRPVDEWSEDLTPGQNCEVPSNCRLCCRPVDQHTEEVLVVHHEALQKVNFLLKHDELSSCESPSVPECVAAVWRSKIQKRLLVQHRAATLPCQVVPTETVTLRRHGEGEGGADSDVSTERELTDEDGLRRLSTEVSVDEDLSIAERLETGLRMWLLTRGSNGEVLQEEVVVHWSASEPQELMLVGPQICTTLPLETIRCMEVALDHATQAVDMLPLSQAKDRETYIYLHLTESSLSPSNSPCHLAFCSPQAAHDFKDWMRSTCPPST
mmetsp:Transcript_107244/g.201873  ORF Transcript_107244/g.201873 Transcript_107244/m.201873 type:complete len:290 (+) Transcript_107244:136-1005(+)